MTKECLVLLKKEFEKRKEGTPETAKKNLQAAGILDKKGNINKIYEGVFVKK